MSNMRSISWLLFVAVSSIAANFAISWYSSPSRTIGRAGSIEPSFVPKRVVIERPGVPDTVLEDDGGWRLVAPYQGRVDVQTVMKLVDSLVFAKVEDAISQAELLKLGRTLSDFGLESPAFSVVLGDGKELVRMSFGCLTSSSNGVYAVIGDSSDVLVLPASVRSASDLHAEAFRERDIFAFGPESVSSFVLKRADGGSLEFARDGAGWRMGDSVASSAKVLEVLSRAAGLKAVDFVWPVGASNEATTVSAPLLAGFGLDPETAVTLVFRCTDGAESTVSLGNGTADRKVYALVHGGREIVTVDAALKDLSAQDAIRFTDARLFPFSEANVTMFSLADGDAACVLARTTDGAWRMDSPVVAPADAETVHALVARMLTLTAADIVAAGVKVSVNTNTTSAVVPASSLLGAGGFASLRSREVLNIDPAVVKRIVSATSGTTQTRTSVVYSRERRTWDVENGDEAGEIDEKAVKELLQAINPLRAERVVALRATSADLAKYGLENPSYVVSVDQEQEGSVRRNILVGARSGTGRYATVGSSDAIFLLSGKTVSSLVSPLVGK